MLNIPVWLTVVDYLKWPITVIVIVLIFILIFRSSLHAFFSRSKKMKWGGFQMETEATHQKTTKKAELSVLENVSQIFRPETSNYFRTIIQRETNFERLNNDTEKLQAVLKYTILIGAVLKFEITYNNIYGSQIKMLQELATTGIKGLGIFEHYYNQAKTNAPADFENIKLTEYSQFLYDSELIVNHQSNGVQITTLGVDFLKYLIDAGKNIYLPL